ncbi:PqqD family protein [Candidatus Beckwithbacteria bacterium]|nr:PqqD family protein [Candidatus Beckwithbacteria bacterium]
MKYKINKGFIVQKLDNKTVIFDGEESVLYTFNETASEIFKLLKKNLNEKEIVKKIAKKYQIKTERAKKDFNDLVSDLKRKKILSSSDKKPKKPNK